MITRTLAALSAATLMLVGAGNVSATTITFTLDDEFSGGTPSSGYPVATLDDSVGPNTVRLTMDLGNLSGLEKVSGWYLNLDNAIDINSLSATYVSGNAASGISIGPQDAYKPDGDGFMDILIEFATSGAAAFTAGETAVYDFTGNGLLASSFNLLSTCGQGCGSGAHVMAAHVQGIGPNGALSGWMGTQSGSEPPVPPQQIPEPRTLSMLGLALLFIGFGVQRQRHHR